MPARLRPVLCSAACLMGSIGLWPGMPASAAQWPTISIPPGVSAFAVGEQFTSNGLPMRVQGFVAKDQGVNDLAAWFRRSLGPPLVENRLGSKLILGRAEDGFYLSIQLEPIGADGRGGSKGLLAVSDMASFNRNREADATAAQRWLERWPSGTQMISRLASEDNGKASLHMALRNGHSEGLNREALIAVMRQDGLVLQQESGAPTAAQARLPASLLEARAFFFKGKGKEGMATVARDDQGHTTVVVNTTTELESYGR